MCGPARATVLCSGRRAHLFLFTPPLIRLDLLPTDSRDFGSAVRDGVRVQVPAWAPPGLPEGGVRSAFLRVERTLQGILSRRGSAGLILKG